MVVGIWSFIHTTEGALHRIDGRDLHFIEHSDSCGCLLGLLIAESTVVEGEEWTQLGHQVRVHTGLLGGLWVITSVHEDTLAPRVAMEVAKHNQFTLFGKLLKELFGIVDLWMKDF